MGSVAIAEALTRIIARGVCHEVYMGCGAAPAWSCAVQTGPIGAGFPIRRRSTVISCGSLMTTIMATQHRWEKHLSWGRWLRI